MSKKGFSFEDFLNPKTREYAPEDSKSWQVKTVSKNIGLGVANKLLKEMNTTDFPVNIDKIVNYLGADVEIVPKKENSQMLGCYIGNGKIYLVDHLPLSLYRSTLAHELGHLVLGHDMRSKWDTIESINDPDPHEQEAWSFASGLLTPKDKLKAYLDKGLKIPELAKQFIVTDSFITVQLLKYDLL